MIFNIRFSHITVEARLSHLNIGTKSATIMWVNTVLVCPKTGTEKQI